MLNKILIALAILLATSVASAGNCDNCFSKDVAGIELKIGHKYAVRDNRAQIPYGRICYVVVVADFRDYGKETGGYSDYVAIIVYEHGMQATAYRKNGRFNSESESKIDLIKDLGVYTKGGTK